MIVRPRFPMGWLMSFVAGACLLIGCAVALVRYSNGQHVLQRIDCGEGREFIITAARSWEAGQPYYYVVRVNGKAVVPTTFLGATNDFVVRGVQFEKLWLDDRDVVAIFERSTPDRFIVVHDFRTNTSWPRQTVSPLSKLGPLTGVNFEGAENRAWIEALNGNRSHVADE